MMLLRGTVSAAHVVATEKAARGRATGASFKGGFGVCTVKWFSNEKGYGFIEREGGADVFVHFSNIAMEGYKTLTEGQRVEFAIEQANSGAVAKDIVLAEDELRADEQHVLLLDEDGSVTHLTAAIGPNGVLEVTAEDLRALLLTSSFSSTGRASLDLAQAFEDILNMKGLREQDIQEFLQAHPEFLLGDEYDLAIPQVVLPFGDGASLRPDFILRPIAGVTWDARIVELKLPGQKLLRARPIHREGMYTAVHDGITQLRAYRRYFEEGVHRMEFAKDLGFAVHRPRLALVLGRTKDFPPKEQFVNAVRDLEPVDVFTYDDLILRYRQLVKTGDRGGFG